MGQALYRKYRSKSLGEVVGQEHITATLAHALETGRLAHAYLFTGPRGVGKTSIARILAHEINGLPYDDDSSHLDIIEIDAASNRRIDEIRELRDKVNIAPSSAKYKVYIIDEVHMLTREAFNALLKTLEEPPAHAVFILATTESHKLPETIVSRTQRFMFKPVPLDKVAAHLRSIAVNEALDISDEALRLIAAHGEGSFRDSISLLDQTRGHDGPVDAAYVRTLTGQPADEAIEALAAALASHDAAGLTRMLSGLRDQGFTAAHIAKRLGQRLRSDVLEGRGASGVFDLLQKLLGTPSAHEPERYLELILLESALDGRLRAPEMPTPAAATVAATPALTTAPAPAAVPSPAAPADTASAATSSSRHGTSGSAKKAASQPAASAAAAPETPAAPSAEAAAVTGPAAADRTAAEPSSAQKQAEAEAATMAAPDSIQKKGETGALPLDAATWPLVLDCLKKSHNTLYGIARMSRPVFLDDSLELYFRFPFHQRRVSEAKNRDVILGAIRQQTGRTVAIRCLVEERGDGQGNRTDAPPRAETFTAAAEPAAPPQPRPVTDPGILAAVNDIFGI